MKIKAYHGSNSPIQKFDPQYSAQGVFWFSTDKDEILQGRSGASSTKYLVEVVLTVDKTAGWEEYEKLGLGQIEDMGFDSIKLDNSYIVFSPRRIRIVFTEEVRKVMSINSIIKIYSENKVPNYLYHATYKPLLKSIKQNGLNSAIARKNWEDSALGVVYLAIDPYVAESYAESSDIVKDSWLDSIVILRIDTLSLDLSKLIIDKNVIDNAGDTYEYHGIIPYSSISIYKEIMSSNEVISIYADTPNIRIEKYSSGNSLVIVDIQPSYESGINFDVAEMLLQAKEYNKVLVLYNGEDLGMESADAIKAWYADKLIESGLDYEEIESEFDHFRFYEKNYGFFRNIMDSNKCFMQTDIVKLIKFMLANNVSDIRELDEEQVKSLGINDLVFDELDNYGFHIPELASELPNWAGSDIVGGHFDECLAEVLLLAKAQGLTFNLRREFIYGG